MANHFHQVPIRDKKAYQNTLDMSRGYREPTSRISRLRVAGPFGPPPHPICETLPFHRLWFAEWLMLRTTQADYAGPHVTDVKFAFCMYWQLLSSWTVRRHFGNVISASVAQQGRNGILKSGGHFVSSTHCARFSAFPCVDYFRKLNFSTMADFCS
jgi:hypothetical protein